MTPTRDSERTRPVMRWGVLGGGVVLAAVAAASGLVVPSQSVTPGAQQAVVVGRTLSVCSAPKDATNTLAAVVAEQAGAGTLTGTAVGKQQAELSLEHPGTATEKTLRDPMVLGTTGSFGANSGGAVLATATSGPETGLSILPCVNPTSDGWFSGLASDDNQSSTVVLTNPDPTQATVDLHLYGTDGQVAAPGSLGIAVPQHSTRVVDLAGLLPQPHKGPLAVQVSTSVGRVAMVAHTSYRVAHQPAGAAWTMGQETLSEELVLAGIPAGAGPRVLTLGNPGQLRAHVTVQVLGADGVFAPADSPTVDVDAQSTAAVDLASALHGEAVAVRLTSTQPITAAMVSTATRKGAAADVAVQPSTPSIRGVGLAPYGVVSGVQNQVVVSNAGAASATVRVRASSFDAKPLVDKQVTLGPGATATVDLPGDAAGFVSVETTSDQVYAGVTHAATGGKVASLATSPVLSALGRRVQAHARMDATSGQ